MSNLDPGTEYSFCSCCGSAARAVIFGLQDQAAPQEHGRVRDRTRKGETVE